MKSPLPHTNAASLRRRARAAYTLVEVLVSSALLGMAMGGAVSLSATMSVQNDVARTTATALNYQDCAARLWQLGLSPAECDAILPKVQNNQRLSDALVSTGASNSVSWGTATSVTLSDGMGDLERIDNTLTLRNIAGGTHRPNVVTLYRPSIR